jgi:hypothetical protein
VIRANEPHRRLFVPGAEISFISHSNGGEAKYALIEALE